MKRLLILIAVMVLCGILFASCDQLPDELLDKLGLGENKTEDTGSGDEVVHEHNFVIVSTKDATCTEAGVICYECDCGEKKEETGDPINKEAHSFEISSKTEPDCTNQGTIVYKCADCKKIKRENFGEPSGHNYYSTPIKEPTCSSQGMNKLTCDKCGNVTTENIPPNGIHTYDETAGASRILKCTDPLCGNVKIREYFGEYKKLMVYTFTEEDFEAFNNLKSEVDAIISAADAYNANEHAYNTNSALYNDYLQMEAKYDELYDALEYITGQNQIAQIEYYLDINNAQKQQTLMYISDIRSKCVADFYSFSLPIYESMYREFYYYGMTEDQIEEYIGEIEFVNNEEYQALIKRNNEIEIQFDALGDGAANSPKVPELYAEFVANNNRLAKIVNENYNNYAEYAYKEVYGREYDPADAVKIVEYAKEYIVPVLKYTYNSWYGLWPSGYVSDGDREAVYTQLTESFFDNYNSNLYLNDYIDLMAFTSNQDKQISFSDEMDKMFENGNYFHGEDKKSMEGAFVTYLYDFNTPIAYFGPGYDNPFTVAHEFGHYMNEVYNPDSGSQSYDLFEMHSQGNEILYLYYLTDKYTTGYAFDLIESYNMFNMLITVISALSVDTFEQAVYSNTYSGTYADVIMADGNIDSKEYDLLYKSILIDFDVYTDDGDDENDILSATYWRNVTIGSPCYYISYAVSALSVLQLYPMAQEDYDAAIDSYLKLFTYTDVEAAEGRYMTTEEILEYAGLYSFTDEKLYASIYDYFFA